MEIIDCGKVREKILQSVKSYVSYVQKDFGETMKLVVIQVEGDAASDVYVRNKLKTCEQVGIECEVVKLPNDCDPYELTETIEAYKDDVNTTALMLQLPLPSHFGDPQYYLNMIPYNKDADGLSNASISKLWTHEKGTPYWFIAPATALGITWLLPEDLSGKTVCILGRSKLVGQPLVKLLLEMNATVTVCHSKTNGIYELMENADIIISAIGKPKFIKYNSSLDGKMFIDVGINRDENGKLCGDLDIDTFKESSCKITPVPKGVGILTTAQLAANVSSAHAITTLKKTI